MGNEIILVVDNDRQVADYVTGTLIPSLGYKSLVAYDAKSALAYIRQYEKQISLILLELQLPDMQDLDFLKKLSELGVSTPFIVITGSKKEEIIDKTFLLGAADFIQKPIDMEVLKHAIWKTLETEQLREERERHVRELEEQINWLTSISDVGRSVTSTLDLDEVLTRIVDASVELTGADQGFIALLDKTSQELYLRVVKNIDDDRVSTLRLPVSDPLVSQALNFGKPIRISRKGNENPLKVCTGLLVTSLLHVPLSYKGTSFGVLSVNNHATMRKFTAQDEAVLVSLAGYASIAIENANLYHQIQQELSERVKAEEALRVSEERYALAVSGANDGIWDWDLKTNFVYFSDRWKSLLGLESDEIENTIDAWFDRIHPEDLEQVKLNLFAHMKRRTPHFISEYRMLHKNGEYRWMLTRGLAVWDDEGNAVRVAGSQSDITDRKCAEQKLLHDALHDALTGLPNRNLLISHLEHAIEQSKRRKDYKFAVLLLDLDHFKNVNDSFGHIMGDKLLTSVGYLLKDGLRSTDTLARFGGDEYVILLEDVKSVENVKKITDWIHKKFQDPITINHHQVYITTSIGVVFGGGEEMTAEETLRDADIAMYVAKANGRARTEIFEPSMRENVLLRLTLEADLRNALDNKELEPYYQPIVSLETGTLIGFEALARWNHPRRGVLNPAVFIPLAEDTGMIIDVDRWILRKACFQMHEWQKKYEVCRDLTISVNISGKQIRHYDFVSFLKGVLNDSGLQPQSLKLEITERTVVDMNEMTMSVFEELRELGVQLQIDDFGIGYSSLGYLSRFPIDGLKIDSSFVNRMLENGGQEDIVQAIVMLTNRLNIRVIAEGVETSDQMEKLRVLGCEYGQGFLVATPLKRQDVEALLEDLSDGREPRAFWNLLTD